MDMDKILHFDPLHEAEQITGKDYGSDKDTASLGFLLHLDHAERKRKALDGAGDTHFRTTFEQFYLLAVNNDFVEVYREHFNDVGESWSTGREETYLIMWRDGVLLTLESYGESVNSAKIYYNLEIDNSGDEFYRPDGSGKFHWDSYEEGRHIYIGDIDVREGFLHHLNTLRAHGTFLVPWIESPFLWFVTYADSRGKYDYKALNKKRINQFPDEVRDAINYEGAVS